MLRLLNLLTVEAVKTVETVKTEDLKSMSHLLTDSASKNDSIGLDQRHRVGLTKISESLSKCF